MLSLKTQSGKRTVTGTCVFSLICIKLVNIKNKTIFSTYYIYYSQRRPQSSYQEKQIKGEFTRKKFLKNNTTLNTYMLYQDYSFVYTEREFSKTNVLDLSFLFIFLSRCINSNNFELIHLQKNIKNTLTLSINVRLKVTRVLCILISRVID